MSQGTKLINVTHIMLHRAMVLLMKVHSTVHLREIQCKQNVKCSSLCFV